MIINFKTKLVDLLSVVNKRYIRVTINMLPDATFYRVLHSLEHQNNKLSSHFDYLKPQLNLISLAQSNKVNLLFSFILTIKIIICFKFIKKTAY